jgi:hypothetical protein
MQTETQLPTLESRKRIAETEAVKFYEDCIMGAEKSDTYDKLRCIFRKALCGSDYGTMSQHDIDSLAFLYDLMDTVQHAINPEIRPTTTLSNDI